MRRLAFKHFAVPSAISSALVAKQRQGCFTWTLWPSAELTFIVHVTALEVAFISPLVYQPGGYFYLVKCVCLPIRHLRPFPHWRLHQPYQKKQNTFNLTSQNYFQFVQNCGHYKLNILFAIVHIWILPTNVFLSKYSVLRSTRAFYQSFLQFTVPTSPTIKYWKDTLRINLWLSSRSGM